VAAFIGFALATIGLLFVAFLLMAATGIYLAHEHCSSAQAKGPNGRVRAQECEAGSAPSSAQSRITSSTDRE